MSLEGVLFDMDGVLVDSEKYICEAAIKMFSEYGVEVQPDDFKPFVGQGENRYLGGVAEKYNMKYDLNEIKDRTYTIYDEIVNGKLKPLNGVTDFIEKCKSSGLRIAVATSADKVKMLINLREIGIPAEKFDATVNGSEVENKKPAPDIFLTAANKINISPENCLVIEDAPSGIEAAKAAGCKSLGILSGFTRDELSKADWTAKDLSDVPNEALNW